jgi:small subunit ribosomal protein S20
MRNHVKNVRSLIQENDKDGAASALKLAVRSLDKAVTKGVLKRATASRTISRLTIAVNKIAAAK